MKPSLVPYVEIKFRPAKRKARSPTASPVRKKRTSRETPDPTSPTDADSDSDGIHEAQSESDRLLHSPTVSDFNEPVDNFRRTTFSPTVSDFARQDSPTRSVELDSPQIPSGSNVTLDDLKNSHSNKEDSEDIPYNIQPYIYDLLIDELVEDNDLVIPGESAMEASSEDDIPVRLLQDFTIYDLETQRVIPVGELLSLRYSEKAFGASGFVKPWADENDDDEPEDDDDEEGEIGKELFPPSSGERVKLSKVIELDLHFYSEDDKSLDSKMYIRTRYAWYILGMPSSGYKPFYVSFWIQHRILHLLITESLEQPRMTYDEFIQNLDKASYAENEFDSAYALLGRALAAQDVESPDVNAYVISTLPELCEQTGIRVSRVPLIRSMFAPSGINLDEITWPSRRRESPSKRETRSRRIKLGDKEKEVLKHRNRTIVTPIVSRVAKNLFKGSLEVTGSSAFDDLDVNVAKEIDNVQAHHSDPKNMAWGKEIHPGTRFYESVIMDGVVYSVGDDVMVNPGDDENRTRARNAETEAAQSANSYANRVWFCRICYFFERTESKGKKTKMFHGQWYVHGSKTILQETAHSKALYLTNKCDDNMTASIYKKCNVKMMKIGEEENPDDYQPDSNDFHCSHIWNEDNVEFLDLPADNEVQQILSELPKHQPCVSCGLHFREDKKQAIRRIPGGYTQYGNRYHLLDFVYVRPNKNDLLLEIAQIVGIDGLPSDPMITVRCFGRWDDYQREQSSKKTPPLENVVFDERRLFLRKKTRQIPPNRIDGICYVRQLDDAEEIDSWVRHDDHFYVGHEKDEAGELVILEDGCIQSCMSCLEKRINMLQRNDELAVRNAPLRGLELFSGAGGLGTGLDMSGFVETRYAVEFSPSAALTYRTNHPHTTVYCQDTSSLLKHAIETEAGKRPKPLKSNVGKTYCPEMPSRHDVDFIYGGPPCQSFSRANHLPRADDIRSTLPGNMLSYVEHYNCNYFLLENVRGLLDYPLMSVSANNGRSLRGGIKSGVVKFVMRTLIALGYQVRYKVLQAGQYGTPQSRRRVIFWGAKRGITIPDFPIPVYAFPKGADRCTLPTGGHLLPATRSFDPEDLHQCAPLRPISVNDAVGDLPPFDWINPHQIIGMKAADKKEIQYRKKQLGIQQFDAVHKGNYKRVELPGFPTGVRYPVGPQNRYQRWLRQKMLDDDGEEAEVHGHYTKRFRANLVEATVKVPLKANADHKQLPLSLQPHHAKPGAKQEKKSFYGRMDGEKHFKCAMTTLAPNVKGSWPLHPSQKRIISVRECARAQGFPDHYVFMSADQAPQKIVDNQIRQIGNAVPVPLALALGKVLGRALIEEWLKEERESSPVL